jgi:hypothetical protein
MNVMLQKWYSSISSYFYWCSLTCPIKHLAFDVSSKRFHIALHCNAKHKTVLSSYIQMDRNS